jgi:hypothetical protein
MNIPENLRYATSHEWILVEGDTGTVGITDHAQAELTDIVFAEPPAIGKYGLPVGYYLCWYWFYRCLSDMVYMGLLFSIFEKPCRPFLEIM